jgi:hypothetical protein
MALLTGRYSRAPVTSLARETGRSSFTARWLHDLRTQADTCEARSLAGLAPRCTDQAQAREDSRTHLVRPTLVIETVSATRNHLLPGAGQIRTHHRCAERSDRPALTLAYETAFDALAASAASPWCPRAGWLMLAIGSHARLSRH